MAESNRLHINVSFRAMVALGLGIAFFFVIALRLWYLQIIHGDEFRVQSENNRSREVFLPPPRGIIYDRNGHVLVTNRPSFNIEFIVEDCPDPVATINALSQIVKEPVDVLRARLSDTRKRSRFEAKILLRDVSRDLLAKVAAQRYRLPGVIINVVPARQYVHGSLGAHVLGYIREITPDELKRAKDKDNERSRLGADYLVGDLVGKAGIEKKMESDLQGTRWRQTIIVDAAGNRIEVSDSSPGAPGHGVQLTLEYEVQQAAETALEGKKGSVVALDPKTGEVLAMVSHPAFDPNIFSHQMSPSEWADLQDPKAKKLRNRAIQDRYPPGSVFKVFMAAAGLSEGLVNATSRVSCPGFFNFAGRPYRCWKKTGHGSVDLYSAIVQSCDVYFYTLGNRLQIDNIFKYMNMFGLGRKTELGLDDEEAGIMPSSAWKKKTFHDRWYPGETISVSIGQGYVSLTPIQIARGLAALVNGGKLLQPYLVKQAQSQDGTYANADLAPKTVEELAIKKEVLDMVRAGMTGVVEDPRGTGHNASLMKEFGIKVGGKTGTAQVAALELHKAGSETDDHAWFAGYAPADDPQIVAVALVENGGHGGSAAAPVVKATMEAFFDKRLPRLVPKLTPTPQTSTGSAQTPPEEHDRAD